MRERRPVPAAPARCKLVLVGDVQCGKTAMLQVLAKDCYPETYVPTVFENYTACLASEEQRVELSLWDTSGSPYYDNVRPLCYSDSDAVLLCFDISRGGTLDSAAKKWKTEILDYCPNTRVLLIGCKTDLRTDLSTLLELWGGKQAPISYEQVRGAPGGWGGGGWGGPSGLTRGWPQGCAMGGELGAEGYLECSAFTSEKSGGGIFRTVSGLCLSRAPQQPPGGPPRSLSKRLLHLPSRSELGGDTFKKEKAKSCSVM
ncbi:RND1 protein, partial [Onychorhynchus coronatus]|nr:RND1 protein [Onychorhynchus coronatus]